MSTTIRVKRSTGKIERLDIEEYLRGVVPAEIGRGAPLEAMKAQAVASRTYALRHIIADRGKEYDVTDTSSNQVYKPEKITAQSDEAICATAGLVMVYDGAPIGAWFSSSNGGRIKSSVEKWGGKALPYSVAKDDPWDTHGGGGHGVGMSQRGAMAMAEQGFRYREILDFYYNGAFEFKQTGEVYMRELKKGSKGEDVKAVQTRLISLGYALPKYGADGDFGNETVSAVRAYQKANTLDVDGIVGRQTWATLFSGEQIKQEAATPAPEPEAPIAPTVGYTRPLKSGSRGEDVRQVQERLHALGYNLCTPPADGIYGSKTKAAVKQYQRANSLDADGIVGPQTWAALFGGVQVPVEPVDMTIPANIGPIAAAAIAADLAGASELRRRIVVEALRHAYDKANPRDYPYSLYIRGGNLYETNLQPLVVDAARIEAGAKRTPYYYSDGAKAMMLKAVAKYPGEITGADCSGGIVGLLRHFGLVSASFDAIADGLCGSSHSAKLGKAELQPGDWVGKSGHIGLYVGGGYVIEWYGRMVGCQLTKLDSRSAYDFVAGKVVTGGRWTKYRRPKYY